MHIWIHRFLTVWLIFAECSTSYILFSTIFKGTKSDCDVINAWQKILVTRRSFPECFDNASSYARLLAKLDWVLTLWELAYNIFLPRFLASFRLPYQHHSSSTDCARELFKGLNGSASLLVCTQNNFFVWGLQIFCEWRHKWSSFGVILALMGN